jgi:hypothetical protein
MRGIPGQQHATHAPVLGHPRAERVRSHPDQLGVLRSEVAVHPRPHLRRIALDGEVLLRVEHEAEPVVVRPQGDDRGRAVRVAELQGRRHRDRAADPEVAHHPRLGEAVVLLPDPEVPAHEAVAPVAGHHERRGDPFTALDGQRDPVGLLLDRRHGAAVPDLHLRHRPAHAVERVLQLGLVHHVPLGPAAAARLGEVVLDEQLAGAVAPLVVPLHVQLREQAVSDAERGERPHRLVVEDRRPRQVVEPRVPLQDDHPVPGPTEQRCRRHPDRAVPHDNHVGSIRAAHGHLHSPVSLDSERQ